MTGFAFRIHLGAHDPADPPEATLARVVAASFNGLNADGTPMLGACGRPVGFTELGRELMLPTKTVTRAARWLVDHGDARLDGGLVVQPEALALRWADHRRRVRLDERVRSVGLSLPRPLLLAALVIGQADRRGQCRLGVPLLSELLGFPVRSTERALAATRKVGALHSRAIPPHWQLVLIPGPEPRLPESAEEKVPETAEEYPADCRHVRLPETAEHSARNGGHHCPKRRSTLPVAAEETRNPEYRIHPDACASARARPPAAAGESRRPAPETVESAVEAFVTELAQLGIEAMDRKHAPLVAHLIEHVGPTLIIDCDHPAERRRREAGHRRERLELARAVIRWCASPERLGRWLLRVRRWFGAKNLAAYLRRAAERGDPGTVLGSHARNTVGHASELWADFSPATERMIEGPRRGEVQQLLAGGAAVTNPELSEFQRVYLRRKLRRLLEADDVPAAREALLELVGNNPSDERLTAAVEGICSLARAREVLAA